MVILTWNVCFFDIHDEVYKTKDRKDEIISKISSYTPDIIVLTEFGLKSYSKITNGQKIIDELEEYEWVQNGAERNYCDVYIAVKKRKIEILKHIENNLDNYKNRWVEINIKSKAGYFEDDPLSILGVYVPCEHNKKNFWERITSYAEKNKNEKAIIIGDFNTYLDTPIDRNKNVQPSLFPEKITELKDLGWIDAWREKHPEDIGYTWNGRRLDYVFISPKLNSRLLSAEHNDNVRTIKLSDHSMVIIEIDENSR